MHWIPVEEWLPEHNKLCLLAILDWFEPWARTLWVAGYWADGWYDDCDYPIEQDDYRRVTHWTEELPAPEELHWGRQPDAPEEE